MFFNISIFFKIIIFFSLNIFKKKKPLKIGYTLNSPIKEYEWINAVQKKTQYVRFFIDPSMGWPDIKQVFRFVEKYNIPTIIGIRKTPWDESNFKQFCISLEHWLVNLYNRFEVPKNVITIQLDFFCHKFDKHSHLFKMIDHMDKHTINKVNHHVRYSSYVWPIKDNDLLHEYLTSDNDHDIFYKRLSHIHLSLELIGPKKFYQKFFRPFYIYKNIKNINNALNHYPDKKVLVTEICSDNNKITNNDVLMTYFILQKKLKGNFICLFL